MRSPSAQRLVSIPHLGALCVLVCACGSEPASNATSSTSASGGAGGMTAVPAMPGIDATVTPFDKTHVFFTGDDNKRIVDATTTFPAEGEYSQIILHLSLDCPQGGCDAWDRFATLGIVTAKGATPEEDEVLEIARYITPYGVVGTWDIDVTDLRPLFRGELTMRTFIDTWVGPGSPYGAGWLVTAAFEMKGGIPAKIPKSVVPVWNRKYVTYGDPAKPITMSVPEQEIVLPKGSSYALRAFVTGHGQGNASNCAEFCKKIHTITAGSTPHAEQIWRADCAKTAVPNQQGTWQYPRAGWCPGADVKPWMLDITTDVTGAASAKIGYDVGNYDNTCRPDAPTCTGCAIGASCEYDGGAHTEPNYQFSALLIAYD